MQTPSNNVDENEKKTVSHNSVYIWKVKAIYDFIEPISIAGPF